MDTANMSYENIQCAYMRAVILFSVAHSNFMSLHQKMRQGIEVAKEQLEECFRKVVERKSELEMYQKELKYPVGVGYLQGVVRFEHEGEEIVMKNGELVKGTPANVMAFSKLWTDAFYGDVEGFDGYKYEVAKILYYLAKNCAG